MSRQVEKFPRITRIHQVHQKLSKIQDSILG